MNNITDYRFAIYERMASQKLNKILSEINSHNHGSSGGVAIDVDNAIADKSIPGSKLEDGAVDTLQLADGAVTTIKIADGSVTNDKLASSGASSRYILLRDQVPSGGAGSVPAYSVWTARRIQTLVTDTGGDCALIGSNQFTLEAGTYERFCFGIILKGMWHKTRLYNITDGTTEVLGMNAFGNPGTFWTSTPDFLIGRFEIAAQKTFEVQYYVTSFVMLGSPVNDGSDEIYFEAQFRKVA